MPTFISQSRNNTMANDASPLLGRGRELRKEQQTAVSRQARYIVPSKISSVTSFEPAMNIIIRADIKTAVIFLPVKR